MKRRRQNRGLTRSGEPTCPTCGRYWWQWFQRTIKHRPTIGVPAQAVNTRYRQYRRGARPDWQVPDVPFRLRKPRPKHTGYCLDDFHRHERPRASAPPPIPPRVHNPDLRDAKALLRRDLQGKNRR